MRSGRGFTLIELMVVVAIVGILSAIGMYSIDRILLRSRTDSAARNFLLDVRFAQSLAGRTNSLVRLQVDRNPTNGCAGDSYQIQGTESGVANTYDVLYKFVCLDKEYPNVLIQSDNASAQLGNMACINDLPLTAPPPLAGDGCSFCGGGAQGILTFYPSGEIVAVPAADPTGIEAVSFSWVDDPANPTPAPDASRVRAVTITTASGRARMLSPTSTVAGGAVNAWECR